MTRDISIESIGARLATADQLAVSQRDKAVQLATAEALLLLANAVERIAEGQMTAPRPDETAPAMAPWYAEAMQNPAAEWLNFPTSHFVEVYTGEGEDAKSLGAFPVTLSDLERLQFAATILAPLNVDGERLAAWVGAEREDMLAPIEPPVVEVELDACPVCGMSRDEVRALGEDRHDGACSGRLYRHDETVPAPAFVAEFTTEQLVDGPGGPEPINVVVEQPVATDENWAPDMQPSVELDSGLSDDQFEVPVDEDEDATTDDLLERQQDETPDEDDDDLTRDFGPVPSSTFDEVKASKPKGKKKGKGKTKNKDA